MSYHSQDKILKKLAIMPRDFKFKSYSLSFKSGSTLKCRNSVFFVFTPTKIGACSVLYGVSV